MRGPKPRVALFVSCLLDLRRPSVGFAALRLLEHAGCDVHVPRAQTCCGQPAYMVSAKTGNVAASGAGTVLSGDLGCLLNNAGRARRQGRRVAVRHVAEVLAGVAGDVRPIGEGSF